MPHAGKDSVPVADQVYGPGGDSIALSKANFAQAVLDAAGDFATVDFEGFRGTFEVIQEAVVRITQP